MCLCQFSFRSNLVEHVLTKMVQKTMDLHVLLNLETTTIVFPRFDQLDVHMWGLTFKL
jgi:hypothetical protein